MMNRKTHIMLCLVFVISTFSFSSKGNVPFKITVSELRDKIAGEWIGQLIGNMYG